MTHKQKKMLYKIIIAAILLVCIHFVPVEGIVKFIVYLVPYSIVGYDILWRAIRNIAHGQIFDENFLMALATVGALGTGDYPEAVFVMLFYQVGELFENYAVGKSRKSIASLMDIRPDYANIEVDGDIKEVSPDEVNTGDIIVIKPGEKIPLDGIVVEGRSYVDTSAITGESVPREIDSGDDVVSGCINQSGLVRVKVTKPFSESTVSKILELIENSSNKKAKAENFITKFAKYYTPVVVISAVLLALIPPIVLGGGYVDWLHRALIFLVISCPCALVISVPLSFFGGIGGASREGILIKGANYLETLSKAEIVVFDKTGTLTKGVFNVTAVHYGDVCSDDENSTDAKETYADREMKLIEIAAYAESYSTHPIAKSIIEAYGEDIDKSRIENIEEISGHGIHAIIDKLEVYVGNDKLMDKIGVKWHPCHHEGTTVHIAIDGLYAGHIAISDEIKEDSIDAIRKLKDAGIKKTVMLTGDTRRVGEAVAAKLGIDEALCELLPTDKVDNVERLLNDKSKNGRLVFVGDGINDAPVLTRADIGIAMGAMGSDAAIEAADVVLMDDKLSKIVKAIKVSKKTLGIVYQNIVFALVVKLIILALGATGYANMWEAIFADVGVMVIAVLNSIRALKK